MNFSFDADSRHRIKKFVWRIDEKPFGFTGQASRTQTMATDPGTEIIKVTGAISGGWYPGVIVTLNASLSFVSTGRVVSVKTANGGTLTTNKYYRSRLLKHGFFICNDAGAGSSSESPNNFYGCVLTSNASINVVSGSGDVQATFGSVYAQGLDNFVSGNTFTIPSNFANSGVYLCTAEWLASTRGSAGNFEGSGWKITGGASPQYGKKSYYDGSSEPGPVVTDSVYLKMNPGQSVTYWYTDTAGANWTAAPLYYSILFRGYSSV